MKIIYRAEKFHGNIDNLFKIFIINMKFIHVLLIMIIRVEEEFFKNIVTALFKDSYFNKIYK